MNSTPESGRERADELRAVGRREADRGRSPSCARSPIRALLDAPRPRARARCARSRPPHDDRRARRTIASRPTASCRCGSQNRLAGYPGGSGRSASRASRTPSRPCSRSSCCPATAHCSLRTGCRGRSDSPTTRRRRWRSPSSRSPRGDDGGRTTSSTTSTTWMPRTSTRTVLDPPRRRRRRRRHRRARRGRRRRRGRGRQTETTMSDDGRTTTDEDDDSDERRVTSRRTTNEDDSEEDDWRFRRRRRSATRTTPRARRARRPSDRAPAHGPG